MLVKDLIISLVVASFQIRNYLLKSQCNKNSLLLIGITIGSASDCHNINKSERKKMAKCRE